MTEERPYVLRLTAEEMDTLLVALDSAVRAHGASFVKAVAPLLTAYECAQLAALEEAQEAAQSAEKAPAVPRQIIPDDETLGHAAEVLAIAAEYVKDQIEARATAIECQCRPRRTALH